MLAGQIALVIAATFAGAAVYINVAEHPARMALPAELAVRQWAPSYKRGYMMQATLAIVGGLAALLEWYLGFGSLWMVGGVLMLANWPFTMISIMPVNRSLLGSEEMSSTEVVALLEKWNRLHAIRTLLGLAAVTVFLIASLG